jgi:UDP-glucose 4-epimerase
MAILVTGGAGYIGSVTVERLQEAGETVVVLDDLGRGHREALARETPFYHGRVGDRALIAKIAAEHGLESCVHFAALAYVAESVEKPEKYFENNVEQGIAFLGSLLAAGVRRIVFSSTAATYGEPERTPIDEDCRQWPKNPYGWSKLIIERLLDSYDAAHGLKFASLRYFNAAGATQRCGEHHDPETHLIPIVLAAAAGEKSEVPVFGHDYPTPDGTAIRDYIHVSDLADAHIRALDSLRQGGNSLFLNLGTGGGYSVLEVVEAARKVTKREIKIRKEARRPGDPASLVADSEKAHRLLGWTPKMSDLDSIIASAWDWKRRNPQGYVAGALR